MVEDLHCLYVSSDIKILDQNLDLVIYPNANTVTLYLVILDQNLDLVPP